MKIKQILLLILSAVMLTGCFTTFAGITKVKDGQYRIATNTGSGYSIENNTLDCRSKKNGDLNCAKKLSN